jgi:hypothetical protein
MTELTETQQGIVDACNEFHGAHACVSQRHEILQEIATRHARYQAKMCKQGHQYWTSRYWELQRRVGKKYKFAEIAAESWPWQKDCTPKELGIEFFTCWRKSHGHWETAKQKHRFFGADMAQGENGIWYACIITGD